MNELVIALGRAQDATNHGWLTDEDLWQCQQALRAARNELAVDDYLQAREWLAELRREYRARMAA